MAENTKIPWTDSTFNPWIGCTNVGPGCDNCYAEAFAKRTGKNAWGNDAPRIQTKGPWKEVVKWEKNSAAFFAEHGRKRRVFCASLADVFDNQVDDKWRHYVWEMFEACPNLNFQVVTKRIGNLTKMVPAKWRTEWPSNVGVIATIVTQEESERDIWKLRKAKRDFIIPWIGLSMEPLLERVEFLDRFGSDPIDWIIVGGESGPKHRPFNLDWARSIRDDCNATGTAFFMKQVGAQRPSDDMIPEDLMIRQYPEALR